MRVSVIGLGYIGLPTAAVLASHQIEVIGVDVNQVAVDSINRGEIHIIEPELDILVHGVVKAGHLRATTIPEKADVFMVAVPTPFKKGGGHEPDLSYVESAVKGIAPALEKGNVVILESTSPVGTTEKMIGWMQVLRPDLTFPKFGENIGKVDISVAYCPERVLPGYIVNELVENDRIIGGVNIQSSEQAIGVYKTFVNGECFVTDCRTAELSKLVENSFRDVNIAFANELSFICDKLEINVWELIELSNKHPRVNILQPGPGVGGHCIAVDPWFIINSVPDESRLIHMARLVNNNKPHFVLDKINQAVKVMEKDRAEITIACLGLAFKPDIDDLRESPALEIALQLGVMGFSRQLLVEPNIQEMPNGFDPECTKLVNLRNAVREADIVVLLVDHFPFKHIDLGILSGKQIIDTRGIWSI